MYCYIKVYSKHVYVLLRDNAKLQNMFTTALTLKVFLNTFSNNNYNVFTISVVCRKERNLLF